MRSGVLLAVLGASITVATAASAQDTSSPPAPPPTGVAPAPPTPPPPPTPPTPPPGSPPGPPPHWDPGPGMHHPWMPGMPPGHPGMPGMGDHDGMHDHDHVQISVQSTDKPVIVERRVKRDEMDGRVLFVIPRHEETETWEQICVSPCTMHVDRSSTLRVSHENFVTQSGTFILPSQGEQVKIDVKPGHWWWHNVGTKLVGTGVVAGIVGASLISVAHTWDKHKSEVHVRTAGIITAAVGAAALAVGIPLAILTQTKVTENGLKVGKEEPNKPPPARLTLDGLVF